MTETTTTFTVRPVWVCGVVRSGYHNGAWCRPSEPHSGWGCGYRYEISIPATAANAAKLSAAGIQVLGDGREIPPIATAEARAKHPVQTARVVGTTCLTCDETFRLDVLGAHISRVHGGRMVTPTAEEAGYPKTETRAGRIHWQHAEDGEVTGRVGSFDRPVFRIWPPDDKGDCLLFVYLAGHQGDLFHGTTIDDQKAKAERLLREFITSFGASFPSHRTATPQPHYHSATGQENTPCLCTEPGTYARQAPNPLDPDTHYHPEVAADARDAEAADLDAGYGPRRWRCGCGAEHSRGHYETVGVHRCLACGYIGTGGVML